MYALVSNQTALMSEYPITHLTAIRVITAMYVLMYSQSALLTE